MADTAEKQNRRIALAGTLVVHGLLFLLFLFVIFKTPIPPYPESGGPGIEINFGGVEGAAGGPASLEQTNVQETPPVPRPSQQDVVKDDEVVTSEAEESISLKKPEKPKKKKEPKKVIVEKIEKTEKKPEPPLEPAPPQPSKELLNALNALKKKQGGGGVGASGTGSGSGEKGTGPGAGGDGTGQGGGGTGGNGRGSYSLQGRVLLRAPNLGHDSHEEGKVIVEIIVDELGRVVKATPGQRGSTTTSAVLYAKARQAALSARFNPSPEGIKEQRGTYTFVFTLE